MKVSFYNVQVTTNAYLRNENEIQKVTIQTRGVGTIIVGSIFSYSLAS